MRFAGPALGTVPFAGTLNSGAGAPIGGPQEQELVIDPFTIEVSGESIKPLINTLSIDIELGRQGTASFTLVNIHRVPLIGEPVRVLYYSEVLFVGAIDRIHITTNNTQTFKTYAIECTDNSYLLFRKKVKRTFTNSSLTTIANALIASELINDGITLGTVDNLPNIPLLDGDAVSAFDLLNEAAVSVGAIFYIDNDRKLNFISTSIEDAPMALDENTIEDFSQKFDRETFRNKQTVIVTGTAAAGVTPNSITYTASNSFQIPQQATIEGTSGTYNDIESITHPTANDVLSLQKLGVSFAKTLLGVRGSIRETITIRTRQYGFRVGQLAAVSLPHLDVNTDWIIQNLSMRDLSGRWLISDMELTAGSLRRRAQEMWLDVVRKGKVVTIPPTAITTNVTTYSTPGSYEFVVPAGATIVQVTCFGAGGGGGGGAYHAYTFYQTRFVSGGPGGNGGLAITVIDAVPGETLFITVPSGGAGGVSQALTNNTATASGTNGGNGGDAIVARSGNFNICLAYGGWGGIRGQANAITGLSSTPPKNQNGSGLYGNVITVGGGASGGGAGNGSPLQNGGAGIHGRVLVEW